MADGAHLGLTPARYQLGETDTWPGSAGREEKRVTHTTELKHKKKKFGRTA